MRMVKLWSELLKISLRKHISLMPSCVLYLGLPCISHIKIIALSWAIPRAGMNTWLEDLPFHHQLFHLQFLSVSKVQINSLTPSQNSINGSRKLFYTRRRDENFHPAPVSTFSTSQWASSCLEAALPTRVKADLKNLFLHQQSAGKLLKTLRQRQVFYQLHHELNEEGAGLEQHNDQNTYSWMIMSILNHQGGKQYKYILQIVYCIQYIAFLKKLELCMLILALPSMERARSSEVWMTFFFSQYNRLFFLFILREYCQL